MADLGQELQHAVGSRYRIAESIGRGGAGQVFRAFDARHDRLVAIKVLLPRVALDTGNARFRREIRLAAGLQHPHILPVFDSGEAEGLFYYVMPLVEGETLRDRLERDGPLPLEEVRRIGAQAGEALAYAHRHGVVHRDVKPGNLLLGEGGVLVADFGIAMALAQQDVDAEELTRTGLAVGSPSYMSPEQGFGDETVDGRSDIYSLGCVLYHALTGEPPFDGRNARAVLASHATDEPRPIRALRADVPAHLERVVMQALSKHPEDRQQDAESLAAAIARDGSARARVGEILGKAIGRRVPLVVLLYVALVLLSPLATDWLVDRFMLSSELPRIVFVGLALLTPSVAVLAYFRRAGRQLAVVPVAANLVIAAVLMVSLFTRADLLSPLEARDVVTEEGGTERMLLPTPEARRKVALFRFRDRSGDQRHEWLSFGLPAALRLDLYQDPFFQATTGLGAELTAAGVSASVPPGLAAARNVAVRTGHDFAVTGEFTASAEGLEATYLLLDVSASSPVARRTIRGADWRAVTDSASLWIRRSLEIPVRYMEALPDRTVGEILTEDDSAFAAFARGRARIDLEGDFAAAIPHLEAAVRRDSTFAEAWASLFAATLATGRGAEAMRAIDAAVQYHYRLPERRSLQIRQGMFVMQGEPQRALRLAERLVSIFPEDTESRHRLADLYYTRSDAERAIAQYDTILRLDSTDAEAEQKIASLYADRGALDSALVHLERYRRLAPSDVAMALEAGEIHLRLDEPVAARQLFDEAHLTDPRNALPLVGSARVERRLGRLDAMGELLRDAWRISDLPEERLATTRELTRLHMASGRVDSAVVWQRRSMEASEELRNPVQHLLNLMRDASLLAQLGRAERGRELIDSAGALLPTRPPVIAAFGDRARLNFFRVLGDVDSVRAIEARLAGSATGAPGEPATSDEWAWSIHMARADLARWTEGCTRALPLYRGAAVGGFTLDERLEALLSEAACERRLGALEEAAATLRTALELSPAEPAFRLERARVALARSDTASARRELEAALQLWDRADPGHSLVREAAELLDRLESTD